MVISSIKHSRTHTHDPEILTKSEIFQERKSNIYPNAAGNNGNN
jgi:hypothetical protein